MFVIIVIIVVLLVLGILDAIYRVQGADVAPNAILSEAL